MTFSLVLVLFIGGERHTFVMDTGLTAGDWPQSFKDVTKKTAGDLP